MSGLPRAPYAFSSRAGDGLNREQVSAVLCKMRNFSNNLALFRTEMQKLNKNLETLVTKGVGIRK